MGDNAIIGRFRISKEETPVGDIDQWRWYMFDTEETVVAVAPYPMGREKARAFVNTLIENSTGLEWDDRKIVNRP